MKNPIPITIFEFFGLLFQGLWALISFLFQLLAPSEKKEPHRASFGDASRYLSRFNKGIFFGSFGTTLQDAFKHTVIFGASGVGKTSRIILNTILSKRSADNQSLIIRDVSGEMAPLCSPYLTSIGYDCAVINMSNASKSSHSFNPIAGEKTIGQLMQISATLLDKDSKTSGDPYWVNSACEACTIFLRILKEQDPKFHTLQNLKVLIDGFAADPASLDILVSKSSNSELINAYKALISVPEKTLQNVISTLKSSAIQLFSDPNICYVTSASTLPIQDIRKRKLAIFVQSSVLEDSHTAPIQSLFFSELLAFLMQDIPKSDELSILFILDEAGSLTFSRGFLETVISTARKYRIGLCLSYQSPLQLDRAYFREAAENIKANAFTKCYMAGVNQQTSEELERLLGKTQYKKADGSEYTAPLLDSFSIRTMSEDRALLIMGNRLPLFIKLRPYYKIHRLKQRASMPPLSFTPITQRPLHTITL